MRHFKFRGFIPSGVFAPSVVLMPLLTFAALASGAAGDQAKAAESPPADNTTQLSEIVVTSNKFGSELSRAPVAADVVSSEEINRRGMQTVEDIVSSVPSLNYSNESGYGVAYIRGVGANIAAAGVETPVAIYVDGVYLQRENGSVLGLVDLKSVSVLQGPQGTLYGRNATGGAILVETADPEKDFGGYAKEEYGRYGHTLLEAVVNLPLSSTFAIRIAGESLHDGNYLDNYLTGARDRGKSNTGYGRIKARWTPTENFTAIYSLEYSRYRTTAFSEYETLPAPYCQVCAIYNVPPPSSGGFYSYSQSASSFVEVDYLAQTLKLTYVDDNLSAASITGVRNISTPQFADQDILPQEFFNVYFTETGPTVTNDTYVRSTFKSPLNFLVGVSFLRERATQFTDFSGAAFGTLLARNQNLDKVDSAAGYAEATFEWSGFGLTAGARYNEDRKETIVNNDADAVLALGTIPAFNAAAKFDSVTPRATLFYKNSDSLYYASYSKGERSGAYPSPLVAPSPLVRPETLNNFEVGAKNQFLGGKLSTNFDIFYGIYKDIQVSLVDIKTGSVLLENAARAKVSGVEWQGRYALSDAFHLGAGATYLDNAYSSFPNAAVFVPPADPTASGLASGEENLSGSTMPRSPRWSGFLNGDYTMHVGYGWTAIASAIVRTTSKFTFTAGAGGPIENDRQGGYSKVDASLDATSPNGKFSFGLYGQNITGVRYRELAQTSGFGAYYVPGLPAMFGVRATQRF